MGVEGLPVRLIVVLVVGVIALSAMVAAMNSFKPQKTLTATVTEVSSKDGNLLQYSLPDEGAVTKTWTCYVNVTDEKGEPDERRKRDRTRAGRSGLRRDQYEGSGISFED